MVFLPIHSGHQVRWTYQPESHRRKVTQDFLSIVLIFYNTVNSFLPCFIPPIGLVYHLSKGRKWAVPRLTRRSQRKGAPNTARTALSTFPRIIVRHTVNVSKEEPFLSTQGGPPICTCILLYINVYLLMNVRPRANGNTYVCIFSIRAYDV